MTNKTIRLTVLSIVIAVGVSLAVRVNLTDRSAERKAVAINVLDETPKSSASPIPANLPESLATHSLSVDARKEVERCVGLTVNSLEHLVQSLAAKLQGKAEIEVNWENVHLVLPDGSRRRVRVFRDGSVGRLKLRVFGEDAEGLPVPLAISAADMDTPSKDVIAKYLSRGNQVFGEKSYRLSFGSTPDSEAAEVLEENGVIQMIQYFGADASIGCAFKDEKSAVECTCLSSNFQEAR